MRFWRKSVTWSALPAGLPGVSCPTPRAASRRWRFLCEATPTGIEHVGAPFTRGGPQRTPSPSAQHGGNMPTHQDIGGISDEDLLQRLVTSHAERYGEAFWAFFDAEVGKRLPPRPVVMDLGCGPGLVLRDISTRYTPAALHGYDITPAMIDYARQNAYTGVTPTLAVHDLTAKPLPVADGSVHLVQMTAVLHVLDDPIPVLADIRRVLAPKGVFALHDWIRTPPAR